MVPVFKKLIIVFKVNVFVGAALAIGEGDATGQIAGSPGMWMSCVHGTQVFSYTGGSQTFTLPTGACPTVTFKVWGAGGGAGSGVASNVSGGGGGFATGRWIASPGQYFIIIVGGGGQSGDGPRTGGYGGGGAGGAGSQGSGTMGGGGGGGLSGVFLGSFSAANAMVVAGGGGGGGPVGYQGGAGGGATGTSGYGNYWTQATGGTGTAGGLGGIMPNLNCTGEVSGSDGAALVGGAGGGGTTQYGGGGGGGGYYGGGGGGGDFGGVHVNQTSCGIHPWGQSGGGGSGYIGYPNLLNTGLTGGSSRSAANTTDPDYVSGVGMGGQGSSSDLNIRTGGHGLIVVQW